MGNQVSVETRLAMLGVAANNSRITAADSQLEMIERVMSKAPDKLECPYPLYLVKHGGGYVSLLEEGADPETSDQALAVFSQEALAAEFIDTIGVMAGIKTLANAREFAWLLASLREPVVEVILDQPPGETELSGQWRVPVSEMLNHHLVVDYSPWNYPVYAVQEVFEGRDLGYSCITGQDSEGNPVTVLTLFTRPQLAQDYLQACKTKGELERFDSVEQIRPWLESLDAEVSAVAIDPVIEKNQRRADQCIGLDRLLESYLVSRRAAEALREEENQNGSAD